MRPPCAPEGARSEREGAPHDARGRACAAPTPLLVRRRCCASKRACAVTQSCRASIVRRTATTRRPARPLGGRRCSEPRSRSQPAGRHGLAVSSEVGPPWDFDPRQGAQSLQGVQRSCTPPHARALHPWRAHGVALPPPHPTAGPCWTWAVATGRARPTRPRAARTSGVRSAAPHRALAVTHGCRRRHCGGPVRRRLGSHRPPGA